MDIALLRALNAEREARRAVVVVTDLETGAERLVREVEISSDPLAGEVGRALRIGRSGLIATKEGECFLTVCVPPPRIVAIGAVHISQALAPMARLAGFDIEIVDPRTAFASSDRFPGQDIAAEWPEKALKRRPLDPYCALVALTHDPKIDDWPIAEALRAGCFYIGALGSRKTHGRRVERLTETGFDAKDIARIDAPIGLDIGAATPAEIAVAVLGALIQALRRGEAKV